MNVIVITNEPLELWV